MNAIATLSLVLIALPAAASCDWSHPGLDPFMGDVPQAVDDYAHIPPDVRAALKAKMQQRRYDDLVTITRDEIAGQYRYGPELTAMHFGAKGKVCPQVSRGKWTSAMRERALVYCDGGFCVAVPTVCRNVALVQRIEEPPAVSEQHPEASLEGGGSPGGAPLLAEPPPTFEVAARPPEPLPPIVFAPPPVVMWAPPRIQPPPSPIPEPGSLAMLLAGIAGICARGWLMPHRTKGGNA